jgi:hypothetical protein
MLVYLAGPISGLNFEGATDWREHAKSYLKEFGIKASRRCASRST